MRHCSQVTITQVQLDQKLFKPGHTVNIQARVKRLDPGGRDITLWDAKTYGERLAVVGRDDLTVGWPHRPFQVEWNPGDQLLLEVYDAKTGLFATPTRFTLAQNDSGANEFPLKSGDFPLEPVTRPSSPIDPRRITSSSRASTSATLALQIQARPRSPSARSSSSEPARAKGASQVSVRLSLDRFEGQSKEIAVLVNDEGQTVNLPRSLLPPASKPGDVLTLTLERDDDASRRVSAETRSVQDKLSNRDPGGDIKL